MELGPSLFLIAVGAILRFAVTTTVSGINLQTVGLIVLIVGIIGFVISLFWMLSSRRSTAVEEAPVVEQPVAYRDARYR